MSRDEQRAPYRCGECDFTAIAAFAAQRHADATKHQFAAIADYPELAAPPEDATREDTPNDGEPHCPECHCAWFRTVSRIDIPFAEWVRECKGCGHQWQTPDTVMLAQVGVGEFSLVGHDVVRAGFSVHPPAVSSDTATGCAARRGTTGAEAP